jgi:CBS domain containing-hemolysin-like protein
MGNVPDLLSTIFAIIGALSLVVLNGFFVASEFAIVKVRRTRLEELAGQGIKAARISIQSVDQLDEYLSATQLGITVVSLGLGWIGEHAFANMLVILMPSVFPMEGHTHHFAAAAISFFVITLLHVVLGELVPKSMAIQDAERVTLWISKPLNIFFKASAPLINLFNQMAQFFLRLLGYHGLEEPSLSEQELKLVLEDSREDGVISESEAQIITRTFEFSDKRASDIMIPTERIQYLSLTRPLAHNLEVVRKKMHTRFPLCEIDLDSVIGIVHMKDAWPLLVANYSNEAFRKCSRPAIFVEPGLRQDRILKTFQARRSHMGVVQDPGTKKVLGLVTMEDILEELVGEITDEHGN